MTASRLASAIPTADRPSLGIGLKVLSALAFTLMSAGIKLVSKDVPVGEIVFFRSAFALVPLVAWLAWQGDLRGAVATSNLKGHLLRGIIGSCGMFAGFVSLSYLPLSDAVAIGYASPLMVVVLAALVLKETVRAYRWTAVGIGFGGVLVMLAPHLGEGSAPAANAGAMVGVLFALIGASCSAAATIQVRRLTGNETTGAIVLYFSLLTSVLGLLTLALGWRLPDPTDLALLILIGILGGIGQILLTESYRYGDASLVAPFEYTTMIWAVLIGWFAFGQLPGKAVALGGVLVAASGIFVLWRERRLGLMRAKGLRAGPQRAA